MTAAIFSSAPIDFMESFRLLFQTSLENWQQQWNAAEMGISEFVVREDFFVHLRQLQWVHGELAPVLVTVLRDVILEHVRSTIACEYEEEELITSFQSWKDCVLVSVLFSILFSFQARLMISRLHGCKVWSGLKTTKRRTGHQIYPGALQSASVSYAWKRYSTLSSCIPTRSQRSLSFVRYWNRLACNLSWHRS